MYYLFSVAYFVLLLIVVQAFGTSDDVALIIACAFGAIVARMIVAACGLISQKGPTPRDCNSRYPDFEQVLRASRQNQRAAGNRLRESMECQRDAIRLRRAAEERMRAAGARAFVDHEDEVKDGVACELALRPGMSRTEINAARRRFAVLNHPDKFPAEQRLQAEHRMQIANGLADAALHRTVSL